MQRYCEYCGGTVFENHPHFIFEHFQYVRPVIDMLWSLASNPALNHLSGFALDSNITQRLVNLGPEKRKELYAGFVLYAQQQRAQYCMQNRKAAEFFSWTDDLVEAVKIVKQKRESERSS